MTVNEGGPRDIWEPGTQEVMAWHGEVVLEPRPPGASPTVSGTVRLSGVVATDGTAFAPIEVTSDCIACHFG